jgi:hypothetical protein
MLVLTNPEIKLTTNGFEGTCGLSRGNGDSKFTENRKVVLSLTSPLRLFYATSRKKISIHVPVSPLFLRVSYAPPRRRGA